MNFDDIILSGFLNSLPETTLFIEIPPENHHRLKAAAALHGKSIKDYVLERALPSIPDIDAGLLLEAGFQDIAK